MGSVCDPASGDCVPPSVDSGSGCHSDAQCTAPTRRCLVAESRCVGCLHDGDCVAGSCDPTSHQCVGLPDSCTSAQQLDLSSGQVTVSADTTRANDDTKLSCSLPGSKSNDLVWLVTITERRRLVATATPAVGSSLRPALALRTVCNSTDSNLNLACAYPPLSKTKAELQVDAVDPGTYFLWAEGEDGSSGAFTLDVRLEVPPPSDSCAQPREIPIVDNTSIEVLADTRGLLDDVAGLCGGAGASDAVYAVKLNAARRLRIDLESLSKLFNPVLYARSTCDDATSKAQIGCVTGTTGIAALDIPRVEAGTLFVFVDGSSTGGVTSGAYRLRITPFDPVPPPTNDTCSAAVPLVMPVNARGTVSQQGDTSAAINDALGCSPPQFPSATGPDLVYQFNLPVPSQVQVRVTPLAGSSLTPAVYLRPAGKCSSSADSDQRACQVAAAPGAAVVSVVPNLPAGIWYLWVDGAAGSAGPFDLEVQFADPPAPPLNDTCASAIPLSLMSGPVNVQGTTLGANADTQTCTFPLGAPSPDVVYEVTLTSAQSLSVDLKAPTGSALLPVATLRAPNACTSVVSTDQVACVFAADPQFPDRSVYTVPNLAPGTYSLWVSGDYGSQGPFSLRLTSGPPILPPANDICSIGQLPLLVQNAPLVGDTRAATNNDYAAGCGLPALADGYLASDVGYRFSLLTAQTVTLSVTPDVAEGQLFRPVVYVRAGSAGCSPSLAAKGCAAAASYGGTATLTLNNLAAGTYTVLVDGAGYSSGKFTIKLQ